MWCPRCGSSQRDWWRTRDVLEELKFCKACGANLYAVRQVVLTNEKSTKSLIWNKAWVAWRKWLQSSEEAFRRQQALEIAPRGLTPEVKHYNEIKGGIITGSVGVALM